MPMIGRGHEHRVNVRPLDDALVFVVGVAAFVGAAGLLRRVGLLGLRLGALALGAVHVAHRQHLHLVAAQHDVMVRPHHQPHADQADGDAVARGVLAEHGGRDEGGQGQRRPRRRLLRKSRRLNEWAFIGSILGSMANRQAACQTNLSTASEERRVRVFQEVPEPEVLRDNHPGEDRAGVRTFQHSEKQGRSDVRMCGTLSAASPLQRRNQEGRNSGEPLF